MDARIDLDQALADPQLQNERVLELLGWAQIGWTEGGGAANPGRSALAIAKAAGLDHCLLVCDLDAPTRAALIGRLRLARLASG